MVCKDCGEHMEGDGFSVPVHCPNADYKQWYDKEPDAEPVYCNFFIECSYCNSTGMIEYFPIDGGPIYHWMKPKKKPCPRCR
ncbi:hypothetical protein [Aeromonas phage Akh-2]|nr:hypothetical protein [Aeromonas phage Akh-2]